MVTASLREIRQPGDYQYVFGPFAEPIAARQAGRDDRDPHHRRVRRQAHQRIAATELDSRPVPEPANRTDLYRRRGTGRHARSSRSSRSKPTRDWAISCTIPYFGGLTSTR